jgi:hypothetical protein
LIRDFGLSISIVEKTNRGPSTVGSKSYWKATQMNRGKAKVGPEGDLIDYAGGLPFPDVTIDDPQVGIKCAWNFDYRHVGDDFFQPEWEMYLTDAKGNIRELAGNLQRLNWFPRTDMDPKPNLNPTKSEGIYFKELYGFIRPFASKGLAQLSVKYIDPRKDRDVWVYVPGLRRNVRIGGGNRCDSLGGLVCNMDEINMWSGNNVGFNWKLTGEKERLIDTIWPWEEKKTGKGIIRKAHHTLPMLELRKVWIIEQTPKDPSYCYSKRIFYLDPESWWYLWEEMYDRSGRLWKTQNLVFSVFPNPQDKGGGATIINASGDTLDLKIFEAGPYYQKETFINTGLNQGIFTLDAMRKAGR